MRQEKITKLWIVFSLMNAPNHRLTITKMRPHALKDLGIASKNGLYPHLTELKKLGLIAAGNGIGYSLPYNWKTIKYFKALDSYFKISKTNNRHKLIGILKSKDNKAAFLADEYFFQKDQEEFKKKIERYKHNSKRKQAIEAEYCTSLLYNSILKIAENDGYRIGAKAFHDSLNGINSLEELEKVKKAWEKDLEDPINGIVIEITVFGLLNAIRLQKDNHTSKKIKTLCRYFVEFTTKELDKRGYHPTIDE